MKKSRIRSFKEIDKMTKENLERFRNDNFLKNYYETDTDAYIVVTVTKENIYDQYSKNSLINNDFFDYLDELYKFANKSKKLNIVFDFDESFSEQEKDERGNRLVYKFNACKDPESGDQDTFSFGGKPAEGNCCTRDFPFSKGSSCCTAYPWLGCRCNRVY